MKNLIIICLLFIAYQFQSCKSAIKENLSNKVLDDIPSFSVDPFWPETFPDNIILGQVSGISVDSKNHVWVLHRPATLGVDEEGPEGESPLNPVFKPAKPVIEFDNRGKMLCSWGGPSSSYVWPMGEHGIFVDENDNVWICAAGGKTTQDNHVLKFKSDGTFLLQIGIPGETGGSNDTLRLGRPTDIAVDIDANEVYISDGYLNRRVIVFDSNTGKYKRHWGAYGSIPKDGNYEFSDTNKLLPQQFDVPHAIIISNDGLVYVCDRSHNRIQVFEKSGKFIFEEFIAENTTGLGSTWDISFSHDLKQKYVYVADGTNQCIWILIRENLKSIEKFGRMGRYAGEFIWVHSIATDLNGNIYTGEVYTGKRAQKFRLKN